MRKIIRLIGLNFKKFLFLLLLDNVIVRQLRTPIATTLAPVVAGAYLTFREFYQDDWLIFANFPGVHDVLTIGLVCIALTVGLISAVSDSYLERHEGAYLDLLHVFIQMNANIVRSKANRFHAASQRVQEGDSVFDLITQPRDQINVILNEVTNFLSSCFEFDSDDDVRITIIEQDRGEGFSWQYIFDTHSQWSQTDPSVLMAGRSAAGFCIRTGEPRFIPDKELAALNGDYMLSDRDGRFGNGSVYCYPIKIGVGGEYVQYVVTIITYGNKVLASSVNAREAKRIAVLFKEICRRLELELTLKALKGWVQTSPIVEAVE